MCTTVVALTPLNQTSRIKMFENFAVESLTCVLAKLRNFYDVNDKEDYSRMFIHFSTLYTCLNYLVSGNSLLY